MRAYWTAFALVIVTSILCAGGAVAVDIPAMPELKTFHTDVPIVVDGQPQVIIAVPRADDYAALGERVAAAVEKISGAAVSVRPASELSPEMVQDTSAILLGYFANNPMVSRIYDEYLITLDTKYPEDGYVIRTVHDPVGGGTNFVYLGGADVEAVTKAVDDFLKTLPEQGDIIYPHTVKVVQADGSLPYTPNEDRVEAAIENAKGKNFRAVASILTGAGTSYYRTGNPEDVKIFRGVAPIFREVFRKLGDVGDMRGAIYLMNAWDAVEESSELSSEDRAEISEIMWELTQRFTTPRVREADPGNAPAGNSWNARVTCDLARYWHKYYGLDPNNVWTWANERFQKQSEFWRSKEDCPGYGGMTMYDVLYYVLPFQHQKYWDEGTGRKMADYGMAVMNNLGGHAGYGDTSSMGSIGHWANIFRVAAWKLRDGRYLYAEQHSTGAGRSSGDFFYNDWFQDEIPPEKPEDIMGVHVVPLPDWVYEHREDVLGTAPSEMNPTLDADPVPPRNECFDKITFRDSMIPEDQYLILGGISHGYHAHPDGNSIIEMTDENRYCLYDSGYFIPDTIEHNTLVIFRDGLFEPVPRLTGLAHLGNFEHTGMTQTYLNGYNEADWRRNIIWNKEKYFVVIDEVQAIEPGNYGTLAVFRTLDDNTPEILEDRVKATYRGQPFNIVSASHTPFKLTRPTPDYAGRHSVIESKSEDLQAGERMWFRNILYTESIEDEWTCEIVPAADNAVFIKSPDGHALAAAGRCEPAPDMIVDAALSHITADSFALTAGKTLTAGQTWFASDVPVDIEVTLGDESATGVIEADEKAVVRLLAAGDTVKLNGEAVSARVGPDNLEVDIPAGRHTIAFTPKSQEIAANWADLYAQAEEKHKAALATLSGGDGADGEMQADWSVESATSKTEVVYVNQAGDEVRNLTGIGQAKCWTEAQRGAGPRNATDGNMDSYCATKSSLAWTSDLPKDIGMEWTSPVELGAVEVVYFDHNYGPTTEGQQLQAWDGEDWYPVEAQISKRPVGESSYGTPIEAWTYSFEPIETTRIRVLITEFVQARTAVREFRVFEEVAEPQEREVRVPYSTHDMAAMDLTGDGTQEIIVAVGPMVKCIAGEGAVLWEKDLETEVLTCDAYDLDGDGRGEIVVGAENHYLYCFDDAGNELWSVETPSDPFTPDREPMRGAVEVLRCGDIDGDGDGEIVLGSGNWFAYAYDHTGELLWTALNWAHHPTSIAFLDLGEGKKASLIGTTYNSANLFGPDGKKLDSVSVGYHGCAMSAAAGDMNGDGIQEMVVGSRVGGLHLKQYQGDITWAKFMGAEVTSVELADLSGDGSMEIIAGSKNFYVLAADIEGNILWNTNVGDSVLDMSVTDITGDGTPEIVVGTEGGMVRVLSNTGEIIATMTVPDNVTRVVTASLTEDGAPAIVAGADDGYVYGGMQP